MLEFPNNQERVRYAAPARAVVLAHVRIPPVNPCLGGESCFNAIFERSFCEGVLFSLPCANCQTLKDVSGVE